MLPYSQELPHIDEKVVGDEFSEEGIRASRKCILCEFLSRNLEEAYQRLRLYDTGKETYHKALNIKSAVDDSTNYGIYRDYLRGRYNGVIDGTVKSVPIFASPMFGMNWSARKTEEKVTALQLRISAYKLWDFARRVAVYPYNTAHDGLSKRSAFQPANGYKSVEVLTPNVFWTLQEIVFNPVHNASKHATDMCVGTARC